MARDLAFVLLVLAALAAFSSATKLTVHNLCPHPAIGGGQCPALGCAVDLNCDCSPDNRAAEGTACRGPAGYFKNRCPLTRTTPTDVEPVPQSCRAPGELKIILCQSSMLQCGAAAAEGADMVIRTVVADN
uniref:Uncharacterized protein n=1 Tax=Aegilops tauschii TaxID=37682 RepID=M8BLQ1_AEGTA